MQEKIKTLLIETLPKGFNIIVKERLWAIGRRPYLDIAFSPNNYEINKVKGQFPQLVLLCLDLDTLELQSSFSGGNGGRCINIKPIRNPHLYCESIRIPFRKPQPKEESVLKCIKTFAENYIKVLTENKENLMYTEYVDYSFLD